MARPTLVPRDMDARFANALQAEFIGTLLFQFLAGTASRANAALGQGFSYAALVYATQHLSGGHLNPAVTFATIFSGHVHWVKAVMYIIAQLLGAVVGAFLQALLIPGIHWGHNDVLAPGCYAAAANINNWELFAWELVLTFFFIYVVYAVSIAVPGHGNVGPLAAGLALLVATLVGEQFTGASLNPARVLGPALVFLCTWRTFWIYISAQLLGALLAAVVSVGAYGAGSAYGTYPEAIGEGRHTEPLIGGTTEETGLGRV